VARYSVYIRYYFALATLCTALLLSTQSFADQVPAAYSCDKTSHAGNVINLKGARVTFDDEFLEPSVTPPEGRGPWYAPMHGGFGEAKFLRPDDAASPFIFGQGKLTIRMFKKYDGKWVSGIMQTVNAKKQGFAQKYGYFEMKAKFPKGNDVWPAFWLKASDEVINERMTRPEIDVIEAYGGPDARGYHANVHLWPAKIREEGDLEKHWGAGCYKRLSESLFDGQFHSYGAEIGPEFAIFYYDRKEIGRVPTLPEFRQPLFMLVDLARYKARLPRLDDEPADLVVDYVRAWQRPEWASLP
jgi:hypothetical protein